MLSLFRKIQGAETTERDAWMVAMLLTLMLVGGLLLGIAVGLIF